MPNPFIGSTYTLASRPASVQKTVNLIPVPLEPGNEREQWTLKDVPGLTAFTQIAPTPPVYTGILNHFETVAGSNVVSSIGPNLNHGEYLATTPAAKFGAKQGGLASDTYNPHASVATVVVDASKSWRAEGWYYPTSAYPYQDNLFSIGFDTGEKFGLARYNFFGSAFSCEFTTTTATGGGSFGPVGLCPVSNIWSHIGLQYNGTTGTLTLFIGAAGTGSVISVGILGTTPAPNLFGTSTIASVSVGSQLAYPDEFYFRNIKDTDLYVDGYTIPTGPFPDPIVYPTGATIRGLWTHSGVLNLVQDTGIFSMDSAGQKTYLGTMNSAAGNVDFASNLTQMVVNDGSYLYVVNPVSKNTQTVFYDGGDRIGFLDQRILRLRRGTQVFEWSDLADAASWNALNFASAESSPDQLTSLVVSNAQILLFGLDSTEPWITNENPSDEALAFTSTRATIDYGCAAPFSAQKTSNSVIWVSQDQRGQAMVLSLVGHQAKRISDRGIEEKFQGIDLSQSTAFTYSDGAHSFYCLNVPALDTTLVWDETFQQWHERAEWIAGRYQKWSPTCHAFAYGKHFFGCGTTLATLDPTVHTYLGNPKRRQRIAPVISSPSRKRLFFSEFEVVCDKGYGGKMILRYSKDNGANWSNERYVSLGRQGRFAHRAKTEILGSAYDYVMDAVVSDPVPWNPVEAKVVFA